MQDIRSAVLWCLILCVVIILVGTGSIAAATGGANNLAFVDIKSDLSQCGIFSRNAAGDGKTDDTEAIQSAIDYLAKDGGGALIFPAGTYRISGITVRDGVRIVGAGVNKTFFRPPDHNISNMIKLEGGRLENFTIYGTATESVSGENWKIGTYTKGKHRGGSTARPVHIIMARDICNGAVMNNVQSFESRYDCLYIRDTKGLRVSNCVFDRAGRNVVSMVGSDEDFVFSNCRFGSLWGLYLFDIEPTGESGRYVRDGLFVNCVFDGRRAGEMGTNDRWGEFFCFKGHKELKSRNITVMGCEFHNVFVRVNHVFPDAKFLYNVFDNSFSDTQLRSLRPDRDTPEVEWGMGAYEGEISKSAEEDRKAWDVPASEKNRTFVRAHHNPVGEFRDAVVRGNRFLTAGKPAERINFGVSFSGNSIFEGNFPCKFNDHKERTCSKEFVYVCQDAGAGGYEAFPDVCRLSDGRLMCVFYAGYGHVALPNDELPKGGRISYCMSSDEGYTWSEAKILYDGPYNDGDPSIAQLKNGRLICNFFSVRKSEKDEHPTGLGSWLVTSDDLGRTWSKPRLITKDYYCSSPVRQLSDGRLILGLYFYDEKTSRSWGAVTISKDDGKTWSRVIDIDSGGMQLDAEPDVIELNDGTLYAAQRGRSETMGWSISKDGGKTWSVSKPFGFAGHCPYLHRTVDGFIVMAHRIPRTSIHYSVDECKTWSSNIQVDEVGGAYPSMVNLKDGSVLIVYYEEGKGSSIRTKRFRLSLSGIEWLPVVSR